jgi:hypothetical protein
MALKIWLIRKIEAVELELKYLKALLIMLEHVEKATDYPDSDDDYSIKTDDIELISESDDEENEKIKQKVLKKIKEIENKKLKN